jgi:VWFA-related protein
MALLCSAPLVCGQQEPVFSTDVKVVNLLATVRSKQGEFIRDLTRDDFSLTEDGRPQTLRYFTRQSDLPLKLGLLIDTSMSQQKVLNAERGAASRFLDQVLRQAQDQVFLVQFDMAVDVKQGFTSNRKTLDDALAFVDTPTFRELRNQSGGGTLLYDAIVSASKDIMKSQRGRKAVIVLTDGVDTGSEANVADAIDAALKADTLVFSILFSDATFYGGFPGVLGGGDGRKVLVRISKETGGGFFEVSKKQSLDRIFAAIEDELRSQYSLGYVSDKPVEVSEFRKIRLIAKQKGLVVQTRERYWAQR